MIHIARTMKQAVGSVARNALGLGPGSLIPTKVFNGPTEDVLEQLDKGKRPKLFSMAGQAEPDIRADENYLYSTRRFPSNTANNTIGGGAVVAGDYPFFSFGLGDLGTVAGYFSLTNLTLQQTNMAAGGKIALGQGFEMYALGISFNAQAIGTDVAQCLDTMNIRFDKQNSQYVIQHGPLKFWPGGTGLYGFAATAVGGAPLTIQSASNGMPAVTNVRTLRLPRILSANESFQYIINAAANLPNVNGAVALLSFVEITVYLFGYTLNRVPS
jgi:hypothetical protein